MKNTPLWKNTPGTSSKPILDFRGTIVLPVSSYRVNILAGIGNTCKSYNQYILLDKNFNLLTYEISSKSLDGYLEHWSQPLFDPENFLPRRRHPESYLDFIWRWHRCFISMGEELFDEETYIQDSQSLIDQKLKELDERTRQKVANILRSGDNSLEVRIC
jgi:hypothetical protein